MRGRYTDDPDHKLAEEAARKLMDRIEARRKEQRARDEKLHDYLGKQFTWPYRNPLNNVMDYQGLRLISYDAEAGWVRMKFITGPSADSSISWPTEAFWSHLKTGLLEPA